MSVIGMRRAVEAAIECGCEGCRTARRARAADELERELARVRDRFEQVACHRDRLIETVRGLRDELERERGQHHAAALAVLELATQNTRLLSRPRPAGTGTGAVKDTV